MTSEGLVRTRRLRDEGALPLLVEPSEREIDSVSWACASREWIATQLREHGALLIRDFGIDSVEAFERFVSAISGRLLDYTNRSTPRTRVGGNIYTSTEYPANQSIPLHNELSYAREWPLKIWFLCLRPAREGGETPIADSRAVFHRIDPAVRDRFMEKKVMYVRTYGQGVDLSWQNVFQTDDRGLVEAFCRRAGIDVEWLDKDRLRTRQVCQAVSRHPTTGEIVWFNQAHLFHISSHKPEIRASLLAAFGEKDLPRNAYYGDGTRIEDSALDEVRRAYQAEQVMFPWRRGDVLMLDNMITAHGRARFVGPRSVLVGMAESFCADEH